MRAETSEPKPRAAKVAVASALTTAAIVLATVGVALSADSASRHDASQRRALSASEAAAVWLRIASDLKETVPARVLLCEGGVSGELEERLAVEGIDRAAFQHAVRELRASVAAADDAAALEAIETSSRDVSLPEGFEICVRPDREPRAAENDAARDLVRELLRRRDARDRNPEKR